MPETLASLTDFRIESEGEVILDVPSFEFKAGERIALVGPNGSGKTLLIESLLGLASASSAGAKREAGWSAGELGAQLQFGGYQPDYRVCDAVKLHQINYGDTSSEAYESLGIADIAGRRMRHLSRGEKQRVDLYVALTHAPKVIVLDEPGTGLDSHRIAAFHDIMKGLLADPARSVLMACHTAHECELMDKVVCMANGRIVHSGTREELIASLIGKTRVTFTTSSTEQQDALVASVSKTENLRVLDNGRRNDAVWCSSSQEATSPQLLDQVNQICKTCGLTSFAVATAGTHDLLQLFSAPVSDVH